MEGAIWISNVRSVAASALAKHLFLDTLHRVEKGGMSIARIVSTYSRTALKRVLPAEVIGGEGSI